MRIAVLGAGAMGSLFGGLLAQSGNEVTLIDINETHLEAIRSHGLILDHNGVHRKIDNLTLRRPDNVEDVPELLIVFTKSLHTRAALSSVSHIIGRETMVLTLQNGLGNVEMLGEYVESSHIVIGVTTWPADLVAPGEVHSHGIGKIRLMSADGAPRQEVNTIAATLDEAALHCTVDNDVWAAVWEKVAFNAALNSICAVVACSVDMLAADPAGDALATAIVGEVLAVALAKGIRVDVERCIDTVRQAITKHAGHQPSMLQDVLAGRRTEIEGINGAVVAAARELNVPVIRTETLLALVRLVEHRVAHNAHKAHNAHNA